MNVKSSASSILRNFNHYAYVTVAANDYDETTTITTVLMMTITVMKMMMMMIMIMSTKMTAMVTVTVVTGDGNVNIDDDDDDHRNVPTLSVKLMAFSLSSSRTKLVGGLGTSWIRGARGCPSATLIQCRCRTCRHYVYFKSKHTEGQNRMSFFSFLLFSSSSPRSGELPTQK